MTHKITFYVEDRALGETYWPGDLDSAKLHVASHLEKSGGTHGRVHGEDGDLLYEYPHRPDVASS